MKIDAVIFDLGNVLVNWSPANLFDKIFTDKTKQAYFLANVATVDWHSEQDAGRSPHEATELLVKEHPDWAHPIRAFYARWKEMFGGPIDGSVEILKELKEAGCRLYALSNWNAELFNDTLDDFPFLQWFDDKVISGEVRLKKPDTAIFRLALDRFGLQPQEAVFIDDSEKNVKAAESLGIRSILFKSPDALRKELQDLNLL